MNAYVNVHKGTYSHRQPIPRVLRCSVRVSVANYVTIVHCIYCILPKSQKVAVMTFVRAPSLALPLRHRIGDIETS